MRILEAVHLRQQAEENLKVVKEELSTALNEVTEKEAMVKQHEKVAEEAVSGKLTGFALMFASLNG